MIDSLAMVAVVAMLIVLLVRLFLFVKSALFGSRDPDQ